MRNLAAALALASAHARLRLKGITVRGDTARNADDLLIGVRELHLVTVEGVHGAARTRNGLAVIGLIQDARNVLARQTEGLELALSLEGELVTAGRGLERAQGQNLHGEGVQHNLVAQILVGVEGDLAAVAVFLGGLLAYHALGGFDNLEQQGVAEVVAHHVVHDAGQHPVNAAALRHLAVKLLFDARGDTLILERHLGQRDEPLVGGTNLRARRGGLGGLAVGLHEGLLLLHEFVGDERHQGEVELCGLGANRAALIEQGGVLVVGEVPGTLRPLLRLAVAVAGQGGQLLQAHVHLEGNGNLLGRHYFSSSAF